MDADRLKRYIEELTLSGCPVIDERQMRNVKKLCRKSADNVEESFHLTLTQLNKDHAEIRLSAFQILDELFRRSHVFRTLVVKELNRVVRCVFDVDPANPIPAPKPAAELLKKTAILALDQWHEKFGQAYKRLKLAHHYLETCHHIDFRRVTATDRTQREALAKKEEKRRLLRAENLAKVRVKIEAEKPELRKCAEQLEAAIEILVPTASNFGVGDLDFDADDFARPAEDASTHEDLRVTGLGSASYNLEIDLGKVEDSHRIVVGDRNAELIQTMDELVKEIEKKKYDKIKKYILSLNKNEASQAEVVELVKARERLDLAVNKYRKLNIERLDVAETTKTLREDEKDDDDDDDDDDDFEDVKDVSEKEGYEPRVPSLLRSEYGLDTRGTSSENGTSSKKSEASSKSGTSSKNDATSSSDSGTSSVGPSWRLTSSAPRKRKSFDEALDPTSAAATIRQLDQSGKLKLFRDQRSSSTSASSQLSSSQGGEESGGASTSQTASHPASHVTSAPVVPYDRDLYYLFENPDAPMPEIERKESSHRFWTPREESETTPLPEALQAGLKMRKIHFAGKFVPVKHKCNVMLPSGKLCPRMDRIKCPFHGVIIARDSKGLPIDETQREKELQEKRAREEMSNAIVEEEEEEEEAAATTSTGMREGGGGENGEVAPWMDEELVKDIEAQTGHDLGSKRIEKIKKKEQRQKEKEQRQKEKGKGKGKKKKPESNLTNVKAANDTVRKRLEKKLFNPSTLKRVNIALNQMDKQKTYDKFGDQFNYVHGLDKS